MTIRRSKIRESAHLEDCALRIHGAAGCAGVETTVLAHLPSVDKGMGYKSPNWWGVYACRTCHDIIDGRAGAASLLPDDAAPHLLRALYETQKKLFAKGLIKR